jgi:hypothetical protein
VEGDNVTPFNSRSFPIVVLDASHPSTIGATVRRDRLHFLDSVFARVFDKIGTHEDPSRPEAIQAELGRPAINGDAYHELPSVTSFKFSNRLATSPKTPRIATPKVPESTLLGECRSLSRYFDNGLSRRMNHSL